MFCSHSCSTNLHISLGQVSGNKQRWHLLVVPSSFLTHLHLYCGPVEGEEKHRHYVCGNIFRFRFLNYQMQVLQYRNAGLNRLGCIVDNSGTRGRGSQRGKQIRQCKHFNQSIAQKVVAESGLQSVSRVCCVCDIEGERESKRDRVCRSVRVICNFYGTANKRITTVRKVLAQRVPITKVVERKRGLLNAFVGLKPNLKVFFSYFFAISSIDLKTIGKWKRPFE